MSDALTARFSSLFAKLGVTPVDVGVVGGKLVASFLDQGDANTFVSLCIKRQPGSATIEAWDNEGTREFMVRVAL